MTKDDHATLLEVQVRLLELRQWQNDVQIKIDAAEAEQTAILRRTEPEDEPLL